MPVFLDDLALLQHRVDHEPPYKSSETERDQQEQEDGNCQDSDGGADKACDQIPPRNGYPDRADQFSLTVDRVKIMDQGTVRSFFQRQLKIRRRLSCGKDLVQDRIYPFFVYACAAELKDLSAFADTELIFHGPCDIEEDLTVFHCKEGEEIRMIDLFQEIEGFAHPAVADLREEFLALFIQGAHLVARHQAQFHLIFYLRGEDLLFVFKQLRIVIDQIHAVAVLLPVRDQK